MDIKAVRDEYIELINKDLEKNKKGALALKDNMERSDLFFHDDFFSKTLQIPRMYSREMISQFEDIVRTTHSICVKVINEYRRNEEYRKLFKFSKEAEELILIDPGYADLLPIARFDIFYQEETGDFKFCEINTDGSSGMNEDRLQDDMMIHNPAQQEMRRKYSFKTFELFDSWVETFLDMYKGFENAVERPNVAIVDFIEKGTLREFEEFERHFQKAGVNCEICDIRELKFRDGKLFSPSGHVVDAIYRRAVTTDVLSDLEGSRDLIDAVKNKAVFLAGSFCTQVAHHKMFFHVLRLPETKAILTDEENAFVEAHVPFTLPFDEGHIGLSKVLKDKDRYILKPEDSYASKGVFAGVELSQQEWEEHAAFVYGKGYICQEYCRQHEADNIDFAFGDGKWHKYIDMAGLFSYNGRFAGCFSRAALAGGIIASNRNERTQATYLVDE